MKCKNCGNECAVGKFCNQCGALLPVEEEVKPAEAAPAQAPQSTQTEVRSEPEQAAEQAAPAVQAESASSEAAPVQEAPAAETTEAPVQEAPAAETTEAPAQEAPAAETAETPAAEISAQEEPLKETPEAEQSAPVQTIPVAAPVQTVPSAAPAGNDIKGKIREICGKVKAKMGEKAYKGVGLWVPAILPAFWGLLIILFLAADGVNAGGFIRDSGYGIMGVTTLEDYAFAGSSFTRVTIPSCVTSVGSKIFYNTTQGSVTLTNRTSVPSSWPSNWAVYDASGLAWYIYNEDSTRIN